MEYVVDSIAKKIKTPHSVIIIVGFFENVILGIIIAIVRRLITENTSHCKPTTSMVLDCGITGMRNTSNR